MDEMKGIAKTVAVGQTPCQARVELARFADGSWAIRKDGPTIGVWEPHEQSECFRVFAMLSGLADSPDVAPNVIVLLHDALRPSMN